MFSEVFKRLFTFELPERFKTEYAFHLRTINAGRLLVFAMFNIALQLALSITIAVKSGPSAVFASGLRIAQLSKFAMLVFFAAYVSYILSKPRPHGNLLGLVNYYFVTAYSFFQLIIVRFEMIENAQIYAFAYGAILLGVSPIFDLLESVTITTVYVVIMIAILIFTNAGDPNFASDLIFICGFSFTALISSRLIFVSHTRSFISEKLILESKNQIKRVADELAILSNTDQLTGINNRRGFEAALSVFWQQCIDEKKQIAVIMTDLDKFKLYNDHYGHIEGDKCLKTIANVMRMSFQRKNDLIGRYGGEEFIAAIAFSDATHSLKQAERFLRKVREQQIPHEYSPIAEHVTISAGIALHTPENGDQPSELIQKADQALYHAKRTGSNRVVCFDNLPDE